ncbi:hypothetical protein BDAP_000649 [Binucleata daphniae]
MRMYDLVANELAMMYKCRVRILPYVMTWDGLVTRCHKKYVKEIGIEPKTEAYIQSLVLRKTLESLSFERRRGLEEETLQMDAIKISEKLINMQAEEVTVVKVKFVYQN